MSEEWRDVPGFEGYYQASNFGKVRSLDRVVTYGNGKKYSKHGRELRPATKKNGYLQVMLNVQGVTTSWTMHKLIAYTFLGPRPPGMQVCHYDGDPQNNHVGNLRYDTPKANSQDLLRHGRNREMQKTHCKWGHEFTSENTAVRTRRQRPGPRRMCRTCKNNSERIRYAQKRDAKLNPQERLALGR